MQINEAMLRLNVRRQQGKPTFKYPKSRPRNIIRPRLLSNAGGYRPEREQKLARMTGFGSTTLHSRSKAQLLSEHMSQADCTMVSERRTLHSPR